MDLSPTSLARLADYSTPPREAEWAPSGAALDAADWFRPLDGGARITLGAHTGAIGDVQALAQQVLSHLVG